MAEPENAVLSHLISLRSEIKAMRGELHDGFDDLRQRLLDVEPAMVSVKRDVNHGGDVDARLQVALDKIASRVQRIERRLDLSDAP